jgi:hypothetical protein
VPTWLGVKVSVNCGCPPGAMLWLPEGDTANGAPRVPMFTESVELVLRFEIVSVCVAEVPTVVVGKVTDDATLIVPLPAGVGVAVGWGSEVGDAVAEGTEVGATVGIGVAVAVGVEVAVRVAVGVAVAVRVAVGVAVAVRVAVGVAVGVGDDDGERKFFTAPAKTLKSIVPHPLL